MEEELEHLRVIIRVTGRVQGVSFRWYTRRLAASLGLVGWVRNLVDGSVELVAEGARPNLERLAEWCRRGPELAKVLDLEVQYAQASGEFEDFSIRH